MNSFAIIITLLAIILSLVFVFIFLYSQKFKKIKHTISSCDICHNDFPESYLVENNLGVFCRPHSELVQNDEWIEIFCLCSNPKDPENGIQLLNFKKNIWIKHQLPSIIRLKYDGDSSNILTYSTLLVPNKLTHQVLDELKNFNSTAVGDSYHA